MRTVREVEMCRAPAASRMVVAWAMPCSIIRAVLSLIV